MLYGACHTSPGEVYRRVAREVGPRRVQVLGQEDAIAHRRAYVVLGVAALRAHASTLSRHRCTVVVVDSYPALASVRDLEILDADRVTPSDYRWAPRPLRARALLRNLNAAKPVAPAPTTEPTDVLANLVRDVRNRGMLDRFLTFLYSIPDAQRRDYARDLLVKHIAGEASLARVRSKLRPDARAVKARAAFDDLDEALSGERGSRLSKAIAASGPEFTEDRIVAACAEHGVDAFDVRYLSKQVKLLRKTKRGGVPATARRVRGSRATKEK